MAQARQMDHLEVIPSHEEDLQKDLFNNIASDYEAHYGDSYSQLYRAQFFNRPMFDGIDLSGMEVLEAMCGSGQTTQYLLSAGASVTALDISQNLMDSFALRFPTCRALCASILDSQLKSESFDCIAVVGGLHHMHPHVHDTLTEIHRLLRPGGYFCFAEPHRGSLPDRARRWWYRNDSLFEENEAAVDFEALKKAFVSKFAFKKETYGGNLAYLLVQNSLIFRVPLRLKAVYASILLKLESLLMKCQPPYLSCFITGQWQKRNA